MERGLDFKGLFFILAIGAISLLTIFSINSSLFYNQLVFWALGLAVFYLAFAFSILFSSRSAAEVKNIFWSFLIVLPPAFLIFIQPDIGNALPILAIWASI